MVSRVHSGDVLQDVLQRVMRFDEVGADGFHRSWIMLFPVGSYEHESYGDLTFTRERLAKIKALYDQRIRHIDAALDVDHRASRDDSRATGWIERLEMREAQPDAGGGETPAGLWGLIKWTPYGVACLKSDEYRYFSPEFGPWKDPETSRTYNDVLIGGALTNRPFLKTMPAITLADAGGVSRTPWGQVDKAKLPRSCFLIVGDPAKKATWRLPVYEGAGPRDADGCYTRRGPLNVNGVKAAWAALNGAHTGQAMAGVPASARAKLQRWHDQFFGDSSSGAGGGNSGANTATETRERTRQTLASVAGGAGRRTVAKRTVAKALLERDVDREDELGDQDAPAALDALDLAAQRLADVRRKAADSEPEDEADMAMDDGADEDSQSYADGADAEDEADGGADEGSEDDGVDETADGHGAMTTSGRGHAHGKFGAHIHENDHNHGDAPMAESAKASEREMRGGKGSLRMVGEAREAREMRLMREELAQVRFRLYESDVEKQLNEWSAGTFRLKESAKGSVRQGKVALTKVFKDAYRAYMLSDGLRLAERGRERLLALLSLALSNSVVELSARSAGSYDPDGKLSGDARKRYTLDESDRMEREAERLALSEHNMSTEQLAKRDPAAMLAIYERAARG